MEVTAGLEIINKIDEFIKSDKFEFFCDLKTDIEKSFNVMKNDIQSMIDNKEIKIIDIALPKKCLYIFGNTILDQSLNDVTSEFILNMLQLISNWNNNLSKDYDIELLCKLMFFLLEINNSLSKAITTLRTACQRNKMLKEWMPPAFEITKDYLNTLLEKAEKLNKQIL